MNFKIDLTKKQQNILEQLDTVIEDRTYSKDEIKQCIDKIGTYIMSQSSKNGDLSKALSECSGLMDILMENEN
ncbi:MAG: hypothetical protein HFJ42_07950 [Clostridia bacterium]|nr:hypothetical protein [Clostridia bacterium]